MRLGGNLLFWEPRRIRLREADTVAKSMKQALRIRFDIACTAAYDNGERMK
ncbi:MAG: hypothetical protein R6X31_01575 [Anaerolineae bacterium]